MEKSKKEDIYNAIKTRIIEEEYLPGEIITEKQISEEFDISRTPVREVLWRLHSDKLLEKKPNKGYSVVDIDVNQLIEIYQVREAIEGMAARLVCQNPSPEFLQELSRRKEKIRKLDDDKAEFGNEHVKLGRKLHKSILKETKNNLLKDFYERVYNLVSLTRNMSSKSNEVEKISRKYHIKIIEAIENKNEDEAERIMRKHLRLTCKLMISNLYPDILSVNLGDSEEIEI